MANKIPFDRIQQEADTVAAEYKDAQPGVGVSARWRLTEGHEATNHVVFRAERAGLPTQALEVLLPRESVEDYDHAAMRYAVEHLLERTSEMTPGPVFPRIVLTPQQVEIAVDPESPLRK